LPGRVEDDHRDLPDERSRRGRAVPARARLQRPHDLAGDSVTAGFRLALATAAALVAAAGGASVPGHAATAPTVVSIQFDDGTADQYGALAILNAHPMHATFYVNSGFIGDSTPMTWAQLGDLYAP